MNRRALGASGTIIAAAAMFLTIVLVAPASAGKPAKTISFCGGSSQDALESQAPTVTINVCRSVKTKTASVTVDVYTAGTTATAGLDYTWAGATVLNFARNNTVTSFDVPILADSLDEPIETIQFFLSEPSTGWTVPSAGPGGGRVSVRILEAPMPPTPVIGETYRFNMAHFHWTIGQYPYPVTFRVYRSTTPQTPTPSGASQVGTATSTTDASGNVNGEWTDLATIGPQTGPLQLGTTYYYIVVAVNDDDIAGPFSSEVAIAVQGS